MSLGDRSDAASLASRFLELVHATMSGQELAARQWVKDAFRERVDLLALPLPPGTLTPNERATYAALAELLSERWQREPPAWTKDIGPAESPVYLDGDAAKSAKLRLLLERNAPEALKRRRVYAMHGYLDVI